jgi:protein FRG1
LLALSATDSPICLASDAAGQVFASPLTASSIAEAEPTDVQQVWVCTKIYGSIEDKFSLRSHQGKYLSVDKHGLLSATREAISPEEEFLLVRCEPSGGRWALQTVREKFIAVEERKSGTAAVRGDSETVGFGETWLVRVQKRNKIQGGGARRGGDDRGRVKDRITKKELEEMAGVKLDDGQIKMLKKARKEGRFHEALLDVRVKHGKHDKFAY